MKPFNRFVRSALLLTGLILMGGCSLLPETAPSNIYRLPATHVPASPGAPVSWSLRLTSAQTSEVLNSPKIAVIPQGNLFSSYAASRWSDPAPLLLRNRLLDGFAQDGRVGLLSVTDSNLQADLELGGQLQAFQTEYQGTAASVVIRLDALLVRGFDQRILASRRFEVRQPLSDVKVPAVVDGFGLAADRLTADVVNWTVEQGQRFATPALP